MSRLLDSANRVETDVLVIGGGIAACLAAIEARSKSLDVMLVDKGHLGRSGNSPLMSGVLSCFDPEEDDYDTWLKNCVEVGEYLNEQDIVSQVIPETANVIRDLQSWGAEFIKKEGKVERYRSIGGTMNAKMIRGGIQLMDAVRGEVIRRGVRLVERVMVVHLLTSDGEQPTGGKVAGALGFDLRTGRVYVFKAKAVIMATGAVMPQRYRCQSPFVLSADGIMMGFRAGSQLKNLEFTLGGPSPADLNLASGSHLLFGQGAYLRNEKGERFMKKYDPVNMERAAKNALGIAVAKEYDRDYFEGRVPIVFLDARHLDGQAHEAIKKGLPIYVRMLEKAGLDLTKDLIRYRITVQACIGAGGIRIDKDRASTVAGLYAAGSTGDHAEDGVTNVIGHGMESAVSGRIAGRSAAHYASQAEKPIVKESQAEMLAEEMLQPLNRSKGIEPQATNEDIGRIWELVSVLRNEKLLNQALEEIKELKTEKISKLWARDYHRLAAALGASNKVSFLELFCDFAMRRNESRGGHFRVDYPERDDTNWLKWIICERAAEGPRIWTETVPFERYPLKAPSTRG